MNPIKSTTLRPGFLVSLHTSVTGNVSYDRRDLERERVTKEGVAKSKWETERTVNDPEEHDESVRVRNKASTLIRSVCAKSSFGLLCPKSDKNELDKAIAEAREIVQEFNDRARITRIGVYVMVGEIAQTDEEAVRGINANIRDLMREMDQGIRNLDVKQIREANTKAKQLGSMLTPEASAKVQMAIDAARQAARKIVKAGEVASGEIDKAAIRRITEARTMFLDLDEGVAVKAPTVKGRAIDLEV